MEGADAARAGAGDVGVALEAGVGVAVAGAVELDLAGRRIWPIGTPTRRRGAAALSSSRLIKSSSPSTGNEPPPFDIGIGGGADERIDCGCCAGATYPGCPGSFCAGGGAIGDGSARRPAAASAAATAGSPRTTCDPFRPLLTHRQTGRGSFMTPPEYRNHIL